jgi:Holliday junction resolvasome RuvABC endonuclease subunit
MANSIYSLGIDPGWKNLGMALIGREDGTDHIEVVKTWTINPSERGVAQTAAFIVNEVEENLPAYARGLEAVVIERYVSYNNVLTSEAENIVSLIGALQYAFMDETASVKLFRAIDWKVNLVKGLVKAYGFKNPSAKLDKKFSLAAAQACIKGDREDFEHYNFPNDHEADAVCLASYPLIIL